MHPANSLVVHEKNSSIDILRLLGQFLFFFFFNEGYFKHLKHKQKHLK